MPHPSTVSFVIATYNRRDVLLSTLQHLQDIAASEAFASQVIVVDNASPDATPDAVRSHFPDVQLVVLPGNLGSCAKAAGLDRAHGTYVVFLDDDSYPHPGSVTRMIERFRTDSRLGCAGFIVHLPDGRRECSALPNVFIGCGAGFRREALQDVGGLDTTFFMAAEEYDLSFRLVTAGWKVQTFTDLHVNHLKTPQARASRRLVYYDTRNNLVVAARYLPDEHEPALRRDWSQRYRWLAEAADHVWAYRRGRTHAWLRRRRERKAYAGWRLGPRAFEYLFRFRAIEDRMLSLADAGIRRVVFADFGKNIRPFVQSARRAGIHVECIADDRFAAPGRQYAGIPIRPRHEGLATGPEAIVLSNTSPVHAAASAARLNEISSAPVYRWFGYDIPYE